MKKKQHTIPFIYKFTLSIITLIGVFIVAIVFGAADTTVQDVWLAITTDKVGGAVSIVRDIRLPREIAAAFVGAALAVSGDRKSTRLNSSHVASSYAVFCLK